MHALTWNNFGKGKMIIGWKFKNEHNEWSGVFQIFMAVDVSQYLFMFFFIQTT